MPTYRIIFNGHGSNRTIYREQEVIVKTPHDWSSNTAEAENVLLLVRKKLREHFSRYEILLIEKFE